MGEESSGPGAGPDGPAEGGRGGRWWLEDPVGDARDILGPEGMAAVGSVADEALKLYAVLKQQFEASGVDGASVRAAVESAAGTAASVASSQTQPGGAFAGLLGAVGPMVMKSVEQFAAAAATARAPSVAAPEEQHGAHDRAEEAPDTGEGSGSRALPGQAAACGYCPICQAIAMFRTVPMSTWHRLGAAVVDAADASMPEGGLRPAGQRRDVVVHQGRAAGDAQDPVEGLLDGLDLDPRTDAAPDSLESEHPGA
jgi:hypothetical protein